MHRGRPRDDALPLSDFDFVKADHRPQGPAK